LKHARIDDYARASDLGLFTVVLSRRLPPAFQQLGTEHYAAHDQSDRKAKAN
jgi:hypothetical protein